MRSFRGLVLLALPIVPALVAAVEHGCSSGQPVESICDWIEYPGNCARQFHNDMLLYGATTQDNPWGDCRTYPKTATGTGIPTEVTPSASTNAKKLGNANGTFQNRAMLDTCVLYAGGSVTVDPPIDPSMWPPGLLDTPVTYTFTFTASDGNQCGTAMYTSAHGFSITVNGAGGSGSSSGAGGGGTGGGMSATDAGPSINPHINPDNNMACPSGLIDWSDAGTPVFTGTYSQVIAPGSDVYNVTCPTGESHTFNLNEVDGPTNVDGQPYSSCPGLSPSVPSASFQIYTGGTDQAGAMSFAIHYPNPCLPPDAGIVSNEPTQSPDIVVYFNCTIPGAPETCVDGTKNGAETDIDCGGPMLPSKCNPGACPARCMTGQACLVDCDCAPMNTCQVDPMSGMKTCKAGSPQKTCTYQNVDPTTGAGGGCPSATTGAGGAGAGGAASGAGGGSTASSSASGVGGGAG